MSEIAPARINKGLNANLNILDTESLNTIVSGL